MPLPPISGADATTGDPIWPGTPVGTVVFAGLFPGSSTYPGPLTFEGGPLVGPANNLYPDTTLFPGQGDLPIVRARYSTDLVTNPTPIWNELTAIRLRNFSISRGRGSEQGDIDAGTATITLDNRDRLFDPTVNSQFRPLNRWWLYEEFSGEIQDLFVGYAQSYDNQWPGWGGSDAEAVVSCSDETMVLSAENLPTTNPPRDSYTNLVLFDQPDGYWGLGDDPQTANQTDITEAVPDFVPPPPNTGQRGAAEGFDWRSWRWMYGL